MPLSPEDRVRGDNGAVWIVGCGDIGVRLGRLLSARTPLVPVVGFTRSDASAQRLEAAGLLARRLDLDAPLPSLREGPRWLFWLAPPPADGFIERRLRHFLASLRVAPKRLVYLSTSAVYGDCAGRWIDEDAPLVPGTDRGLRRLDGERTAREFCSRTGAEVVILRVPGIYGPGRLPVDRLTKRTPLVRRSESPFTNRIHADDLAAAAILIAERGEDGAAYHVSDGNPTTMTDYFLRCAALVGLPEPDQIGISEARQVLPEGLRSFLEESKRLRIDRLRALGWSPRYPTLEEGLPTCR